VLVGNERGALEKAGYVDRYVHVGDVNGVPVVLSDTEMSAPDGR